MTLQDIGSLAVVGLDIGRGSCFACVMPTIPPDFKRFVERYKPIRAKADPEGLQTIAALGDIFAMEPTGSDHRIWSDYLIEQGKLVLFVSGVRIRNEARRRGLMNKSDREDAPTIAIYTFNALQQSDMSAFMKWEQSEIRDNFRMLRSIGRSRVRLINILRARLMRTDPELALKQLQDRAWTTNKIPQLWRTVAQEDDSPINRKISNLIIEIESLEAHIERELEAELRAKRLSWCEPVFERWELPQRTRAAILCAIDPFDQFLEGGKRNRYKKAMADAEGEEYRTGRDASLAAFKRALGCGMMRIQSGNKEMEVRTGDKEVTTAVYSYLEMMVVTRRQPSAKRLFLKLGKPADSDNWTKRQRKEWIKAHSFRETLEPAIKELELTDWHRRNQITECLGHQTPYQWIWEKAADYSGTSIPIARLQLFYEFAPQCQNLKKVARIWKTYSKFCEWLFKELYRAWQDHREDDFVLLSPD